MRRAGARGATRRHMGREGYSAACRALGRADEIGHINSILRTPLRMSQDHETVSIDDEVSSELAPVLPAMQVGHATTEQRSRIESHDPMMGVCS
jgi:hypothetical protein